MTNGLRPAALDPAGHPAVQQKNWSVFRCNASIQNLTNTPVKSNICPNLTQPSLITHPAWARDKRRTELQGWNSYG